MKLRKLESKDAHYMLEWMQDPNVSNWFRFDFSTMSVEKVLEFIENSLTSTLDKHYAIVNEEDEYLGTVSLKNIDSVNLNAEYAITLRTSGIGKGFAKFATNEILKIAFEDLELQRVYLNVRSDNERAISFYTKFGFVYEGEFINHLRINNDYYNLKWFAIVRSI